MSFDLVLKVFLLLTPIICLPLNGWIARFQWYQFGGFSGSASLLQLQFFQYGVVMLFLTALFEKPKRLFQDRYFGLLLFICIWNVIFYPKTILNFHNIFLGFLLYYLVVSYAKDIRSILKVIVVVAILNTIFAVLQFYDIHLIYRKTPEIIGLMNFKTQLGIYQALAMPICYSFNPYLSIIPLIGLLLSKSLTSLFVAIAGMVWLLRKKIFWLAGSSYPCWIFAFSCIGLICIKSFHKLSLRFDVWLPTLKMMFGSIEKFIYGYGVGVFKYTYPIPNSGMNMQYDNPYSLYLGVTYALGILGIIALILFIKDKFRGFKDTSLIGQGLFASCLILVLSGVGYSILDYPRLAGTSVVLFGLLTIMKGAICENQI